MNYYNEIKTELLNNEVYKKVKDYSKNKSDLMTYYNVGKLLVEAQGGTSKERNRYGNTLIKRYSQKLSTELGKGYSWRNLYNMRSYYLLLEENKILQAMTAKLTWSHFCELLVLKDINKILYYIKISDEQNISYRKYMKK